MQLKKLRIAGFKSFCEPCDFIIQPGLTGIVGPNGCGKSNLVEAMRWVMGESSYKNMRASGMDDVIFSGASQRPPRNLAEVLLVLDNTARTAPAAFNDNDVIEVIRQIARGQGSTYKINGREVRARDVQLLFADAATGARSTAMVRQGQIGEIIAAKPTQRRRILEDAAGIAGLYTRRQEAELRLKATEDNLARVADVLQHISAQADSLRKQAKIASRYRTLQDKIREQEALLLLAGITHEQAALSKAKSDLAEAERRVEAASLEQAEAARNEAVSAHALEDLRQAEQEAQAKLQGLVAAKTMLEAEEKRLSQRLDDLARRREDSAADIAREEALLHDAVQIFARLSAEREALASEVATHEARAQTLHAKVQDTAAVLKTQEEALSLVQMQLSDAKARRTSLERAQAQAQQHAADEQAALNALMQKAEKLTAQSGQDAARVAILAELEAAQHAVMTAEQALSDAQSAQADCEREEQALRAPLSEAVKLAQSLATEVKTLTKMLAGYSDGPWTGVIEAISVDKGLEAALGAALGDALEASLDGNAPAYWAVHETNATDTATAPALPEGVMPLSAFVRAPPVLHRALAQIGVVAREAGSALQAQLSCGQSLVSREGALWRWDGFVVRAEAVTPAARRLIEKNRLAELRMKADAADGDAKRLQAQADIARQASQSARASQQAASDALRTHHHAVERVRGKLQAFDAQWSAFQREEAALKALMLAKQHSVAQSEEQARLAEDALAACEGLSEAEAAVAHARAMVDEARQAYTQANSNAQSFAREDEQRRRRLKAIGEEEADWTRRVDKAREQADLLAARLDEITAEQATLSSQPEDYAQKKRALLNDLSDAEAEQRMAVDRRVEQDRLVLEAKRAARSALEDLGVAREQRARLESAHEAVTERLSVLVRKIAQDWQMTPDDLVAQAGLDSRAGESEIAPIHEIEQGLQSLRLERERMGAVNLRAEEELAEAQSQHDKLVGERDDLEAAVKRLRAAITTLNREGRERLTEAFAKVDQHFRTLFTRLFGGGAAELQLIDAEDPLEAGLEILARPPGKRPQTMTLLSGGEQALTALSLIFAVFLTNPSPVCVLDEVDAPLDDANVERFCELLDAMRQETDTRFVVITHNPVTMARMDRLFGVTMAERGVSQLVSVDLEEAERFLDAG